MRVARLVSSLVLILSSCPGLSSQQSNPTATRDANAIALLSRAVATLGGSASYSQTSGVVARGNLTAATGGISGPILWENAGTEFRYERPGPNGSIIFVSGHGNPAIADGGKVQRNIGHVAMVTFPWHLPSVVLASQLRNANVQVAATQQVTLDGASAIKLSLNDETDELSATICKQDWYFDSATLLPTRVDFLAAEVHNALNNAKMTVLLSDYRSVSGALIPFHMVTLFEGQQISDVALTSVQLNVSIPTTDFDARATTAGVAQ
jgi:hypothetical protein